MQYQTQTRKLSENDNNCISRNTIIRFNTLNGERHEFVIYTCTDTRYISFTLAPPLR